MHHHPLGFREERSSREGIAPYGGSVRPGPLGGALGTAAPFALEGPQVQGDAVAVGAGALFSVAVHSYRLRRVDTDWRRRRDEVLLSPEEAAGVLEQAIAEHEGDRHLQQVLRAASVRLAGVHPQGMFVLLRIEPEVERVQLPVAPAPPAATPSALRPSLPVEVSSRSDEPILGDDQAAVLRQAAVLGVPFCEECARIAAERRAAMQ